MSNSSFVLFEWPPWVVMWTLAIAIYAGCKGLTWQRAPNAPAWKHAAYLLAWPGLDAARFLEGGPMSNRSTCRSIEWLAAATRLIVGLVLLFLFAPMIPPQHVYIVGWIGGVNEPQ